MEVNNKSKEITNKLIAAIGKGLLNFIPIFPKGELHKIILDLTQSKKRLTKKLKKLLAH